MKGEEGNVIDVYEGCGHLGKREYLDELHKNIKNSIIVAIWKCR